VQVPIASIVRLRPSTLQIKGVADTTVGVRRLEAVTVSANGVELIVFAPGFEKEMVWAPAAIVISIVPLAEPKLLDPDTLTVNVPA
jgi:hypothetical protein